MARSGPIALLVVAKVWSVPVAVHPMVLSLVTKEAGCGRELDIVALLSLASERLDVRVEEFAWTS